jgi:recombination protein RecR
MASLPRAVRDLISVFERLPGIGPKSAVRLAFYLVNAPISFVEELAGILLRLKKEVKICRQCFSVSDAEICEVCRDGKRQKNVICVVERAIEVIAIENVGGFSGVYHVLGGVINPLEHIGPEEIRIEELLERLSNLGGTIEVIMATNPTMEGEATALYIKNQISKLKNKGMIKISRIGSGLPMGGDIEYADQATLNRALEGRRDL